MRPSALLTCGILLLSLPTPLSAQQRDQEWEELLQTIAETAPDDSDPQAWQAHIELLSDLHENPIDLNLATRDQLLALPFLSPAAVDDILDYRTLHQAFYTLGELILIPSLTAQQRRYMHLFLTIPSSSPLTVPEGSPEGTGPTTALLPPPHLYRHPKDTTWWGRATHDLLTRTDIPLYQRRGWNWPRGIAQRIRYTWQQGRHINAGLRLAKDPGESLFTRENPFWDSYGAHIMITDIRPFRHIIIGDFKATFGHGLVISNTPILDKTTAAFSQPRHTIRPHRSADEVNYLRGIAATADITRHATITALYSYRRLDATVADDNTVAAISTTGLHRTPSERARKNTLGSHTTAIHAAWQQRRWHAAATALYQYYDHVFRQTSSTPYRQIRPEGHQFGAVSIDYGYRSPRLALSGETARSFDTRGGGWATLNKATWNINPNTALTALQRFYSYRYVAPHATAYGENSEVQNESGIALILQAQRLGPIDLQALLDIFHSPWPRYSMTRPSTGWEGSIQASCQLPHDHTLRLRYRVKSKEASDRRHYSHLLRTTYLHTFTRHWSAQATLSLHHYRQPRTPDAPATASTGFAFAPRIDYTATAANLRLSLAAILFRTADYDSRLYLYEPALFNTFSIQQLYGSGQRLATTFRFRTPDTRWTIQAKLAVTHYSDRSTISSGILQIDSPWKPDMQLLFRLTIN